MECRLNGKPLYLSNNRGRMLARQAVAAHLWGDCADNLDSVDFV